MKNSYVLDYVTTPDDRFLTITDQPDDSRGCYIGHFNIRGIDVTIDSLYKCPSSNSYGNRLMIRGYNREEDNVSIKLDYYKNTNNQFEMLEGLKRAQKEIQKIYERGAV